MIEMVGTGLALKREYLVYDLLRLFVMAGAVLLSGLVLRVAWLRRGSKARRPDRPHILTSLAYVGALGLMAIRRIEAWNKPGDWHLGVAVVIVICGIGGMLMNVTIRPPWRKPPK